MNLIKHAALALADVLAISLLILALIIGPTAFGLALAEPLGSASRSKLIDVAGLGLAFDALVCFALHNRHRNRD